MLEEAAAVNMVCRMLVDLPVVGVVFGMLMDEPDRVRRILVASGLVGGIIEDAAAPNVVFEMLLDS